MHWYHIYVIILFTIGGILSIYGWIKDKRWSSTEVTVLFFAFLIMQVILFHALDSGGFWNNIIR